MSDYGYYSKKSQKKRRKRRGLFTIILNITLLVITIMFAVALLLALLSKWIDPRWSAIFAFSGLFYHLIYFGNIICGLYWIVKWRKYAFIPLALIVLGIPNVRLFYKANIKKNTTQISPSENDLTVLSYNVMNFDSKEKNCESQIANFINSNNVSIACLQEVYISGNSHMQIDKFKSMMPKLPYSFYRSSSTDKNKDGSGLAIFSTYPIVDKGVINVDATKVSSIWADLKIGRDTIRVICNHLQSHYIDEIERKTLLTPSVISDTLATEKIGTLAKKMATNYRKRASQADILGKYIKNTPYKLIVCGDFNDTPTSYVYNEIRGELNDAFVEKGVGFGITYNGLFNLFRIDYIFTSDDILVKEYRTDDVDFSDHKPIIAILELDKTSVVKIYP